MRAIPASESVLLKAFLAEERNWYTESELQRTLEERNIRIPVQGLITLARKLAEKQFLDIHFIHPPGGPTSGFVARLSNKGVQHLRQFA